MANFRRTRSNDRRNQSNPEAALLHELDAPSASPSPSTFGLPEATHDSDRSHAGTVWMTVVEAAQYVGYACTNGRAPNSFYAVAKNIGHFFNGKWLIDRDDLDAYIRGERPAAKLP